MARQCTGAHFAGSAERGKVPENSEGMDEDLSQVREQQVALTRAYEAACTELGIGAGSLDVWRKEKLAGILEALAGTECLDWASLARKTVAAFRAEPSQKSANPS